MTLPRLHLLVTDEVAGGGAFGASCAEIQARCGPSLALHLRLRDMSARRLLELAEELEEASVESGGWLVINGRVDVALAAGADAVQLGETGLPVEAVRGIAGDSLHIGASVHDLATADRRRREGADYLLVGTVFQTPSHPSAEPGGPDLVRDVARTGLPVVAIGGIDAGNATLVRRAGAHGIAVIRAVWMSEDPVESASRLCAVVDA